MSTSDFFRTGMGRDFYQGHIPSAVRALEAIAHELSEANRLKRFELECQGYNLSELDADNPL